MCLCVSVYRDSVYHDSVDLDCHMRRRIHACISVYHGSVDHSFASPFGDSTEERVFEVSGAARSAAASRTWAEDAERARKETYSRSERDLL